MFFVFVLFFNHGDENNSYEIVLNFGIETQMKKRIWILCTKPPGAHIRL